jgi:hypothetical protein
MGPRQQAGVADLAATFGIKRGAVQHDQAFIAFIQHLHRLAIAVQRHDAALSAHAIALFAAVAFKG